MIYFSIYLPNGDITRTGFCSPDDFAKQAGQGELIIEGASDTDSQWVVDGNIVDLPAKPTDSQFYYFDYTAKAWVFNKTLATNSALTYRDQLLQDGPDRISPLWWDSMTAEVKAAWSKYRQDLLDVPNQPGFPKTIVWPTRPNVG